MHDYRYYQDIFWIWVISQTSYREFQEAVRLMKDRGLTSQRHWSRVLFQPAIADRRAPAA